jgi:hypothetical protein
MLIKITLSIKTARMINPNHQLIPLINNL